MNAEGESNFIFPGFYRLYVCGRMISIKSEAHKNLR